MSGAKGKIKASLYDLGNYPGAVKSTLEVIGDIYLITSPNVLDRLDEYEGDEFIRTQAQVQTNSFTFITAWVYWYVGDYIDKPLIKNNDYLNYLNNK
jgi:gamma-glutamylcyclotransferase (GGCT)/AIG2-like uncharacterized protein YtfP